MDNFDKNDSKSKLILAGLKEIGTHGIEDFSLRRVADACGMSCAAPYRHFKDKNDFILEIVNYIHSNWKLMENHLCTVYSDDKKQLIKKLCLSIVSFNLANDEYRAVFIMGRNNIDSKIINAIEKVFDMLDNTVKETYPERSVEYNFLLHSIIYGAVLEGCNVGEDNPEINSMTATEKFNMALDIIEKRILI